MKVFTTQPFQVVYSLFEHEYLGYLFESFVVQVNSRGQLTLQHQNISAKNSSEFSAGLDANDFKLVQLMDQIQQDAVLKRFSPKKMSPVDFFLKVYDPEKGDKALQETISHYMQGRMGKIMELLRGKQTYIMGKDGEPTWRKISIAPEKASVLFHFHRQDDGSTHYFPTIKYAGQKLEFMFKNASLICYEPAWLMLNGVVYSFEKPIDGKKLQPFLNKRFIAIPRSIEENYFSKFVAPLMESFDVYASAFEIKKDKYTPEPLLVFSTIKAANVPGIFARTQPDSKIDREPDKILFELAYKYGNQEVQATENKKVSVSLEKTPENFIFHRLVRDGVREKEFCKELNNRGLDIKSGKAVLEKGAAFAWLGTHISELEEQGYTIKQSDKSGKNYFIGDVSVEVGITEKNDWFDIYGIIRFGEFEIPFIKLKSHILTKNNEFVLPNGQIAIIPDEWFTQYIELFAFSEGDEQLTLRKHHMALVNDLYNGNLATVTMSRKLEKLREFETIEDHPMPVGFKGELRPYQKAGYNWLQFVQNYKFGGCLADDMGLGKTVQTLAMLQHRKEQGAESATMLVMPTSLIYNWLHEAQKFTPDLRVLSYTGTYRNKDVAHFQEYDVVLTSYGIVRLDAELLKQYYFDYIILDESQAIKNPDSTTSKAVRSLKSKHRLILTGTPVENSTMDLWSQMSFINPGLLGNQHFFRNEFLKPIEKEKDEQKTRKLHALIKPFILRRHKSQVAKELPEKIEHTTYCKMTEEQGHAYEETKSFYRNKILTNLEENGPGNTQFMLLQGLMKLRQIANHPLMADPNYEGESGKIKEVLRMTRNVVGKGHKVLIFSQFVKHLEIVRAALDERGITYAYLDGNTKNRHQQVELFQTDETIQVFLISLKAGGVGLNLTAADYVFILDPWWNPAVEAQAVDRAHRIGQQNTVFTYKFITKDSVEEKILALQNRKLQLVNDLITTDENVIKNLTKEDIDNLLS
ncbi:DEAD/DEAH box helicase family protein [Pontibacter sp. BT310]|uniref:DEAD/DEAH box helicase family protein n=1 Tax=Pontibacter populi TaxID=890055 RepID=A0ABS6X954_9BACT|nr:MULTISPECIES: SNF2-related protein [Pontibacter]MBJ6117678.1 DEAD/DEAH box helicase family protein [Pontibacter sp. BT310]MBR0570104.1 DEAD/DEAH box helicase family protein [Microvirga sp. STS03]MBW3364530.1 DEAD/DEAH box helicase family protein [Pontibacter populi]